MEWNKSYYAGKTAAVTGAASGIGLALCELMLEYGAAKVTLSDYNKENLSREVERLSKAYPGKVNGVVCDVTVGEQVFDLVKQAYEFGNDRLDILINCAGAAFTGKFIAEPEGIIPDNSFMNKVLAQADWDRGFALNFTAPVHGCEAAVGLMIAQGSGQIINISSGIAFSPMAYQSLYAATKAALVTYSYAIRGELRDYGIKVNAATPGTTATGIFKAAGQKAPPEAQSPRDSAETILRGASQNKRFILGDKSDEGGCVTCFLPDDFGRVIDGIYTNFARARRSGALSFVAEVPDTVATELMTQAQAISQMKPESLAKTRLIIGEYAKKRDAMGLDPDYYNDKTAVVTGGASGVGFALCKKLLEIGAKKVVLADFNKENLANKERELNETYPGKAKGILCNVADEQNVKDMIGGAREWFDGSFDILINCAEVGQTGLTFPVPDAASVTCRTKMRVEPLETWKRVFSINVNGVLFSCRAALPIMLKQGSGQIVNIISGTALIALPYQAIYASSKAAVNLITLSLRYEFGDCGIKFNSATAGTAAAQPPETSAIRILTGVERNDRLIPGDDDDLCGMFMSHNPAMAKLLDEWMCDVVREQKGK